MLRGVGLWLIVLALLALIHPQNGTAQVCASDMAFVKDITVPDGMMFEPGETFQKIWAIRNTGTCAWIKGYELIFIEGDGLTTLTGIAVQEDILPGQTAQVGLEMTAPSASGTYTSSWQMHDDEGQPFGDILRVRISVSENPTATVPATEPTRPRLVSAFADLLEGFVELPLEKLHVSTEDFATLGLPIETLFAFVDPASFQVVFGLTVGLQEESDRAVFDQMLTEPDTLLDLFLRYIGSDEVQEEKEVTGLENVGDAAAGKQVVVSSEGGEIEVAAVLFRMGETGAFLALTHETGQEAPLPITEAPSLLQAALEETPVDANGAAPAEHDESKITEAE